MITEEFIKIINPEFRQSIKKIGRLRRFKGEAKEFCCVYFLVSEEDEVVYVGQTANLLQRVGSHQSNKNFSKVYYLLPPSKVEKEAKLVSKNSTKIISLRKPNPSLCTIWMNETERKFILNYLPKYNNCSTKKKSISDLFQTYSLLKANKKNLNKLAQYSYD